MPKAMCEVGRRVCLIVLGTLTLFSGASPRSRVRETAGGITSTRRQQQPAPSRPARGDAAAKIPFELSGNHVFLRCRVNGSGPLWFLLDTGASLSVINDRRARSLGLVARGRDSIGSVGGPAEVSYINDVSLDLPGAKLAAPMVASAPLSFLESVAGRPVDGILGYDLFRDYVVEINYEARTIELYDPATFSDEASGETLPIEIENDIPFVHAAVVLPGVGKAVGLFEIDTGATDALTMTKPFADSHRLLSSAGKTIKAPAAGGGGESEVIVTRIGGLQLGSFFIRQPITAVSQDVKGDLSKAEFAGLVGGELLRRFDVLLDYAHRRLTLRPNRYFNEPYRYDMSGMSLVAEGNDFKVFRVYRLSEHAPAKEAGLREGDVILEINGRPVSRLTLDEGRRIFSEELKEYRLRVRRGSETLSVRLKPRRLI